jgi:phosphatidylglycerophosphatase A
MGWVANAEGDAKNPLSRGIALAIATSGGVGFIPLAPGTFGSAIGVFLFFCFTSCFTNCFTSCFTSGCLASGPPAGGSSVAVYFAWLASLAALGSWAAGRAEEIFDRTDDGRIVIDEVVGQLITLTPLVPLIAGEPGERLSGDIFFLLVVTGFVTFRVLDIYKPGMVRWTERNISGGAGVMADDCVAGVLGAIGLALPTAGLLWLVES